MIVAVGFGYDGDDDGGCDVIVAAAVDVAIVLAC